MTAAGVLVLPLNFYMEAQPEMSSKTDQMDF